MNLARATARDPEEKGQGERTGARAAVVDSGSFVSRAGFAGDACPRVMFPSVIGHSKSYPHHLDGAPYCGTFEDLYIGEDALRTEGALAKLVWPIERGVVCHWEHMEKVWRYSLFSELNITCPQDCCVLFVEPPLNPRANRERLTQMMFETMEISALSVNVGALCVLQAAGDITPCPTGAVVESGYSVSHAVPVFEGHVLHHAVRTIALAGRDLTQHMLQMIMHEHESFGERLLPRDRLDVCRDFKKKLCRVALDYDVEIQAAAATSAAVAAPASSVENEVLPDGSSISVGTKLRIRCPEALFRPSLLTSGAKGQKEGEGTAAAQGIHEMLFESISACDEPIRNQLYGNIVLSGGSTMFPNLAARMAQEIIALAPAGTTVNVNGGHVPCRAWVGGSRLAAAGQARWITAEDYWDAGPTVVHSIRTVLCAQ